MSQDEISDLFERHHGGPRLEDAGDLVAEARRILRRRYLAADVGITGANFLIAETGSAITVTNEGNAELTQGLPRTHIVVATLEKVVPTMEDAFTLLRLLARSATGQEFSTYTTVMTGPRRPGDLDGPEHFHVVLLDNGRTQMLGNELRDMLRCIRCGACMNHCPVYLATGGHAYGWVYPGPMGSVLTPQLIGIEKGWPLPNASTFCGRCEEVCPGPHPPAAADAALARGAVRPRAGAARRPLGPGDLGLARPPTRCSTGWPRAWRRRVCDCWRATASTARATRGRLDRDAGPAGSPGRHLHEPVARRGAAGERARRDPRSDPARPAADGGGGRSCRGRPWRNAWRATPAISSRSAASSTARAASSCSRELAKAVMTDVQRIATLEDVPAAVTAYLRRHNLPQRLVLAPEPLLDRCRLGQPAAAAGPPRHRGRRRCRRRDPGGRRGGRDRHAGARLRPRAADAAGLPAGDQRGRCSPPTGSRRPTRRRGNRSAPCPGGVPRSVNFVTGPSRTADIAQKLELGAHGPRRLLILLVEHLEA